MTDAALTTTLDLVQRAKVGDDQALNRLFDRYYDRVRRVVRSRIGPRMRSVVETGDILQEAMFTGFRNFDNFDMRTEGAFLHWLTHIAENSIRDKVKHFGAKKRDAGPVGSLDGSTEEDGSPRIDVADTGRHDPAHQIAEKDDWKLIEGALDELSETQRELILLRDFEGLSHAEVAEVTGRATADAARVAYSSAKAALTVKVKSLRTD